MKQNLFFKKMFGLILIITLFCWNYSYSADTKTYKITNGTGAAASDLHVTFTGTGGTITTVVKVNPAGCPAPAIPSNMAVTNTMVLDWGANCVPAGGSVTVEVTTPNGPLAFSGGCWTSVASPTCPGIGPVNQNDIVQSVQRPNDLLPPNPPYKSSPGETITFVNGVMLRSVSHENFNPQNPPPPPGGSQNHFFNSTALFEISVDNGQTWQPHSAPAFTTVHVNRLADNGITQVFETEMLQLDLAGGSLPPGIMVRESPTNPSLGKHQATPLGGGDFMVNSFFDVFTQLSVDGGQTWLPANQPLRVTLTNFSAAIPTLSEWGLILMALLLLTTGIIFIYKK